MFAILDEPAEINFLLSGYSARSSAMFYDSSLYADRTALDDEEGDEEWAKLEADEWESDDDHQPC